MEAVCRRGGAHPTGSPPAGSAEDYVLAQGSSSVGEDVFVVGHGVHVVARFAGPRPGVHIRRGAGGGQQRRAVPEAQVAQDFFDDFALVNDGDDAPRFLAVGADERVGVPDFEDEVAPLFGREFGRWRWPRILLEYQPL